MYRLDTDAAALLEQFARRQYPEFEEIGPEAARQQFAARRSASRGAIVARTEDRLVPTRSGTVPVRVYWPESETLKPLPIVVFFHAGGWVVGSVRSHDDLCRELTAGAGCITVSVDYRLAPEAPFPAALHDCFDATVWVADNAQALGGDPTRLALAGDSAGGNLATVTAAMARDNGGPAILHQLLIYPVIGFDLNTASMRQMAEGPFLTRSTMAWFFDCYASLPDRSDARADPRLGRLDHLPATTMVVAGMDPVRDSALDYVEGLNQAGTDVTLLLFPGQFHGFYAMTKFIGAATRAQALAHAQLRTAFESVSQ